jgi:hypothetical protein
MQVRGSVRQHAYLMIPHRPSGSARAALRRHGFGALHPKASRRLARAIDSLRRRPGSLHSALCDVMVMMPRARRPAVVLTLEGLPIDEIVLTGPRMHHLSANVASKQSGNSQRNPFLRDLVNCRAFRALEYDYYPHDNADLALQNKRRDVIYAIGDR